MTTNTKFPSFTKEYRTEKKNFRLPWKKLHVLVAFTRENSIGLQSYQLGLLSLRQDRIESFMWVFDGCFGVHIYDVWNNFCVKILCVKILWMEEKNMNWKLFRKSFFSFFFHRFIDFPSAQSFSCVTVLCPSSPIWQTRKCFAMLWEKIFRNFFFLIVKFRLFFHK